MLRTISIRLAKANNSLGFLTHRYIPTASYGNASGSSRGFGGSRDEHSGSSGGYGRPGRARDTPQRRPSGFGLRRPESNRESWSNRPDDNGRVQSARDTPRRDQAASQAEARPRAAQPRSGVFWDRSPGSFRDGRGSRDDRPTWQKPGSDTYTNRPPPSEPSRLVPSRETLEVIDADSFSSLRDAAASSSSSSSSATTVVPAPENGKRVIADLDDFFAGHADPVITAPTKTDTVKAIQPRQSPPVPSSGTKGLATYTPPRESGVEMVKRFMMEHKFLTTQQIWQMGTDGLKPVLQPDHVIEPNGRIRMKRVATMREGRRPWVPPAAPSFPDHPFRSVRFLKETVLASLESAGVIHKRLLNRPLETEEEHKAAIWKAESINRKAERRAVLKGHPTPAMRAPATSVAVWAWLLGPAPAKVEIYDSEHVEYPEDHDQGVLDEEIHPASQRDLPPHATAEAVEPAPRPKPKLRYPPPYTIEEARAKTDYTVDDAKWHWAAIQEFEYHKAKLLEAQATAERQAVRRQKYREIREEQRRQAIEDAANGVESDLKKEQRRLKAIEDIEEYGRQTGEDVSGWFDEIGRGPLGEVGTYEPRHQQRGGAVPRGKNPRKGFKPVGFPIN